MSCLYISLPCVSFRKFIFSIEKLTPYILHNKKTHVFNFATPLILTYEHLINATMTNLISLFSPFSTKRFIVAKEYNRVVAWKIKIRKNFSQSHDLFGSMSYNNIFYFHAWKGYSSLFLALPSYNTFIVDGNISSCWICENRGHLPN